MLLQLQMLSIMSKSQSPSRPAKSLFIHKYVNQEVSLTRLPSPQLSNRLYALMSLVVIVAFTKHDCDCDKWCPTRIRVAAENRNAGLAIAFAQIPTSPSRKQHIQSMDLTQGYAHFVSFQSACSYGNERFKVILSRLEQIIWNSGVFF